METRWVRAGVPAAVLILATALRLWGLGSPPELYWDEQYYVFDAEAYLGGGIGQPIEPAPAVRIADEGTWVHPPLGKWAIALLGVGPFGLRATGWRFPSAVFGVAGVGVLYLLALRLWRSVAWAGLAALLLALDGLHIVQSRLAMLDIFLTTFITAGALLVVLDRQHGPWAGPRWRRIRRIFGSPYRFLAGVMLGAAVATKWSGILALALFAVLSGIWSFTGDRHGRSRTNVALTLAASFLVVPMSVYLLSYGAFFAQHGAAIHDFVTLQARMLEYHLGHRRPQPESSRPWTWPLLLHPIQYFGADAAGSVRRIVALGNPVLWWGFLASLPIALATVRRRLSCTDALIFCGYGALFLPWFVVGRNQFFFYMLPAVPFMCLGLVATLRILPARISRIAGGSTPVLATAAAALFSPLWLGVWVPRGWVDALAWLPGWPR